MKTDWQNLLWNWTTATEPYRQEQWKDIAMGLLDSLVDHFQLPFHCDGNVFYDIDHPYPRVVFAVTYEPDNPLIARIVGRCGIGTWDAEDGAKNIQASISFHYFQGDTRLVAENETCVLEYGLVQHANGGSTWKSNGWLFDACGETENCTWEDLCR